MTKATIEKLDEAVKAVRALPDEVQAAIAHELMKRVTDFSKSCMIDEQRMEKSGDKGSKVKTAE